MTLRRYQTEDNPALVQLFRDTVHTVCAGDYTPEQREAWAPQKINPDDWCSTFAEDFTLVAEEEGQPVGFGNIDGTGYLDRLYVHRDFQGRGVATTIAAALEAHAMKQGVAQITCHASITARPFFEKRGYRTLRENTVERRGVTLTNYLMEKRLRKGER